MAGIDTTQREQENMFDAVVRYTLQDVWSKLSWTALANDSGRWAIKYLCLVVMNELVKPFHIFNWPISDHLKDVGRNDLSKDDGISYNLSYARTDAAAAIASLNMVCNKVLGEIETAGFLSAVVDILTCEYDILNRSTDESTNRQWLISFQHPLLRHAVDYSYTCTAYNNDTTSQHHHTTTTSTSLQNHHSDLYDYALSRWRSHWSYSLFTKTAAVAFPSTPLSASDSFRLCERLIIQALNFFVQLLLASTLPSPSPIFYRLRRTLFTVTTDIEAMSQGDIGLAVIDGASVSSSRGGVLRSVRVYDRQDMEKLMVGSGDAGHIELRRIVQFPRASFISSAVCYLLTPDATYSKAGASLCGLVMTLWDYMFKEGAPYPNLGGMLRHVPASVFAVPGMIEEAPRTVNQDKDKSSSHQPVWKVVSCFLVDELVKNVLNQRVFSQNAISMQLGILEFVCLSLRLQPSLLLYEHWPPSADIATTDAALHLSLLSMHLIRAVEEDYRHTNRLTLGQLKLMRRSLQLLVLLSMSDLDSRTSHVVDGGVSKCLNLCCDIGPMPGVRSDEKKPGGWQLISRVAEIVICGWKAAKSIVARSERQLTEAAESNERKTSEETSREESLNECSSMDRLLYDSGLLSFTGGRISRLDHCYGVSELLNTPVVSITDEECILPSTDPEMMVFLCHMAIVELCGALSSILSLTSTYLATVQTLHTTIASRPIVSNINNMSPDLLSLFRYLVCDGSIADLLFATEEEAATSNNFSPNTTRGGLRRGSGESDEAREDKSEGLLPSKYLNMCSDRFFSQLLHLGVPSKWITPPVDIVVDKPVRGDRWNDLIECSKGDVGCVMRGIDHNEGVPPIEDFYDYYFIRRMAMSLKAISIGVSHIRCAESLDDNFGVRIRRSVYVPELLRKTLAVTRLADQYGMCYVFDGPSIEYLSTYLTAGNLSYNKSHQQGDGNTSMALLCDVLKVSLGESLLDIKMFCFVAYTELLRVARPIVIYPSFRLTTPTDSPHLPLPPPAHDTTTLYTVPFHVFLHPVLHCLDKIITQRPDITHRTPYLTVFSAFATSLLTANWTSDIRSSSPFTERETMTREHCVDLQEGRPYLDILSSLPCDINKSYLCADPTRHPLPSCMACVPSGEILKALGPVSRSRLQGLALSLLASLSPRQTKILRALRGAATVRYHPGTGSSGVVRLPWREGGRWEEEDIAEWMGIVELLSVVVRIWSCSHHGEKDKLTSSRRSSSGECETAVRRADEESVLRLLPSEFYGTAESICSGLLSQLTRLWKEVYETGVESDRESHRLLLSLPNVLMGLITTLIESVMSVVQCILSSHYKSSSCIIIPQDSSAPPLRTGGASPLTITPYKVHVLPPPLNLDALHSISRSSPHDDPHSHAKALGYISEDIKSCLNLLWSSSFHQSVDLFLQCFKNTSIVALPSQIDLSALATQQFSGFLPPNLRAAPLVTPFWDSAAHAHVETLQSSLSLLLSLAKFRKGAELLLDNNMFLFLSLYPQIKDFVVPTQTDKGCGDSTNGRQCGDVLRDPYFTHLFEAFDAKDTFIWLPAYEVISDPPLWMTSSLVEFMGHVDHNESSMFDATSSEDVDPFTSPKAASTIGTAHFSSTLANTPMASLDASSSSPRIVSITTCFKSVALRSKRHLAFSQYLHLLLTSAEHLSVGSSRTERCVAGRISSTACLRVSGNDASSDSHPQWLEVFETLSRLEKRLEYVLVEGSKAYQLALLEEAVTYCKILRVLPPYDAIPVKYKALVMRILNWCGVCVRGYFEGCVSKGPAGCSDNIKPFGILERQAAGVPVSAYRECRQAAVPSVFHQRVMFLLLELFKTYFAAIRQLRLTLPYSSVVTDRKECRGRSHVCLHLSSLLTVILDAFRRLSEFIADLPKLDKRVIMAVRTTNDDLFIPLGLNLRCYVPTKSKSNVFSLFRATGVGRLTHRSLSRQRPTTGTLLPSARSSHYGDNSPTSVMSAPPTPRTSQGPSIAHGAISRRSAAPRSPVLEFTRIATMPSVDRYLNLSAPDMISAEVFRRLLNSLVEETAIFGCKVVHSLNFWGKLCDHTDVVDRLLKVLRHQSELVYSLVDESTKRYCEQICNYINCKLSDAFRTSVAPDSR
eukprot:GHVQ01012785.1.p1 GENE.GHVQ01012785.1~~GHVQ01012785.1.p1  ORF type:complete len:2254 (-),score=263.21 GHVQ01012785.1:138-6482(-)